MEIRPQDDVILQDQCPLPRPLDHELHRREVFERTGMLPRIHVRILKQPLDQFGIKVASIMAVNEFILQATGVKLPLDMPAAFKEVSRVDDKNSVKRQGRAG
jgi:hypothetical protein